MPSQTPFWLKVNSKIEGFKPEARVCVQSLSLGPNGDLRGDDFIQELQGFSHITTAFDLNGAPRCSITLPSPRDKYFRAKRKRRFPAEEGRDNEAYLEKIFRLFADQMKEINPYRRDAQYQPRLNFRSTKERVNDYIQYIYEYGTNAQSEVANLAPDLVVRFGLMQRVFVDFKGRDERWYAGFTGIVANIGETYDPAHMPIVHLQCIGMLRFLQLAQIYTQEGAILQEVTRATEVLKTDPNAQNISFSTILGNKDGASIITFAVRKTLESFCYQSYQTLRQQNPKTAALLQRGDFFYDEPFWQIPVEKQDPASNMVRVKGTFTGQENFRHIIGRPAGEPLHNGDKLSSLRSYLHIDRHITEDKIQALAFDYMIQNTIPLFQSTHLDAYNIVQTVAKATFYDFFENPAGDLVFQIPKLNNFPANLAEPGQKYDWQSDGDWDYSPVTDGWSELGHGINYAATDSTLQRWQFEDQEGQIITYCQAPSGNFLIDANSDLRAIISLGRTNTTNDPQLKQLQGRYGLRVAELPQVVTRENPLGNVQLQNAYARAALVRFNARERNAQFGLKDRPDLVTGKNLFMVERQALGFITGIQQNWTMGRHFRTNLTLEFVHDIADRIPNPWQAVEHLYPMNSGKERDPFHPPSGQPLWKPRDPFERTPGFGSDPLQDIRSGQGPNRSSVLDEGLYHIQPIEGNVQSRNVTICALLAELRKTPEGQNLSPFSQDLVIAHAVSSTGMGESASTEGKNLFNLRQGSQQDWSGPVVRVQRLAMSRMGRHEYGGMVTLRAYTTFGDSFRDYLQFMARKYPTQYALLKIGDKTYLLKMRQTGFPSDIPWSQKQFDETVKMVKLADQTCLKPSLQFVSEQVSPRSGG
jgi:hypothetical protein